MHDRGRWILGYGSLIRRQASSHARCRAAGPRGWALREVQVGGAHVFAMAGPPAES